MIPRRLLGNKVYSMEYLHLVTECNIFCQMFKIRKLTSHQQCFQNYPHDVLKISLIFLPGMLRWKPSNKWCIRKSFMIMSLTVKKDRYLRMWGNILRKLINDLFPPFVLICQTHFSNWRNEPAFSRRESKRLFSETCLYVHDGLMTIWIQHIYSQL